MTMDEVIIGNTYEVRGALGVDPKIRGQKIVITDKYTCTVVGKIGGRTHEVFPSEIKPLTLPVF